VVRPDLDKLVRAVLDALSEAGVWRDDAQVVSVVARKAYGSAPGLTVEIVRRESLPSPRVANEEG
jgi:crossover junction endodeoxyribonuclease RusA